MSEFWTHIAEPAAGAVTVAGVEVRAGSRVRLHPRPGGDIMDLALADRIATVEGIDQDDAGRVHLAVTLDDDPGRDLGAGRHPGHRFFFAADEIEPLATTRRVLVAGIGNVFLGDDGFGVAVARRLAQRPLPAGVTVQDFGIRGMDLAYALREYDTVVFVDAAARGREPGSLELIAALDDAEAPPEIETHGMDPVRVLALARVLGPLPRRVLVLGCEPSAIPPADSEEIVGELSPPVATAVDAAVVRLEALFPSLLEQEVET